MEEFAKNIAAIKEKFLLFATPNEKYDFLIELGRSSPPLPEHLRTPDRIVPGCQSVLYLHTEERSGKLFFTAHSDALISAGLAALLISAYSGMDPQTILLNPPKFLHEIGLFASLSPHRSNGLASIYLQMKKEALYFFNNGSLRYTLCQQKSE